MDYGVAGEPWHERYVFSVLENKHAVVITPDYDVHVEVIQVGKDLFRNLRMCPAGSRNVPAGLGAAKGQTVYRFSSHIIPHKAMAMAQKLHDKEKKLPHLPIKAGDTDTDDDADDDGSDDDDSKGKNGKDDGPADGFDRDACIKEMERKGGRWIIVGGNFPVERFGEPAVFPAGVRYARFDFNSGYILAADDFVQFVEFWPDDEFNKRAQARRHVFDDLDGDKTPRGPADGKEPDKKEEEEDARTLPVLWSQNGYRVRPFHDAARMLEMSEMDEKDFPLDGPRSSSWFLTAMANGGTTPLQRHGKWIAESGVGADSRSGHEHSILSHILEKTICVDQLNVVNLVGMEIVVRRLILLEEAHSVDPGQPSFEGWEHWLGLGERRAGILIPPELSRHVARKVGDEAAVAKERRKAKEERKLAKKSNKGDGKGKSEASAGA